MFIKRINLFLVRQEWKLLDIVCDFGIDGLPLFKSSTKQVWPISGSVVGSSYVFEGISKPNSANDFFKIIFHNIIVMIADKFLNIKVRCFVMDVPSKSFVLGSKGHVVCLSIMRTLLNACVKKKGEDYSLVS